MFVIINKLCLFSCFFCFVYAMENYCLVNTYSSNGTYMQFTKEPSIEEFAIVGQFKELHCCAKGYRSIEWLKDGKQYPWPLTLSNFIIYSASANQTVYTPNIVERDSGNYTCLLRNDSVVHSHTIRLRVFDKIPDDAQITYISKDKQVPLGGNVRLFCEAFAGRIDLPDAYNEAIWRKKGENTSLDNAPRIRQEKTSREDNQTFGTYLIFEGMRKEDYGEYICEISKSGNNIERSVFLAEKVKEEYINPNPVPVGQMLLWLSAILFLCLTVVVLNLQFGLPLRVRLKDTFGHLEENDGKVCDVLIVHSPKDTDVALGVLQPTLEAKYNYKCSSRELPDNISSWYTDLIGPSQKCRRIVAVFSPATLNENWNSATMFQATKQLKSLDPKLTCITLKELPASENIAKNSEGETLASIMRTIEVIQWQRSKDDKFWLALRLRLPPKRRAHTNIERLENLSTQQGENSSRLTSDSQESLDNLV